MKKSVKLNKVVATAITALFTLASVSAMAGTTSKLNKSHDNTSSFGLKANVQMPTSALIADAMREAREVSGRDLKLQYMIKDFTYKLEANPEDVARQQMLESVKSFYSNDLDLIGNNESSAMFLYTDAGFDLKKGPLQIAEYEQAKLTALDDYGFAMLMAMRGEEKAPANGKFIFNERMKCVKIGANLSPKNPGARNVATSCFAHYNYVIATAEVISATNIPVYGWAVNPGHVRKIDEEGILLRNSYISGYEMLMEYSNLIQSEIAGKISGVVMKDPVAAKLSIQKALFAMPNATFINASNAALKLANDNGNHLSTPASSTGIVWAVNGTQYVGDDRGLHMFRNGIEWFGSGFLNGKQYSVGMESAISVSDSKQKSQGSNVNE